MSEAEIAVETAMQMAESKGEDMAIMSDLSVKPLREATGIKLEIVRCPAPFKTQITDVD